MPERPPLEIENNAAEMAARQAQFASAWADDKFARAVGASGGRYEDEALAKLERDTVSPPADVTAALMGDPGAGQRGPAMPIERPQPHG